MLPRSLLPLVAIAFAALSGANVVDDHQRANADSTTAARATAVERAVTTEHRYRMAGRIRPLLYFWVGRDNVGSARIEWTRGADGSRGWELLIGSDPTRAPARVNRWGYVREEVGPDGSSILGVMKESDEQTLDQARSTVEKGKGDGYVFKLLRSRVEQNQASATTWTRRFDRDFTFRDLAALLSAFDAQPVASGGARSTRLAAGVRPGFLTAVADLVHLGVEEFARSGRPPRSQRLEYAYNGGLYDVTMEAPRVQKGEQYGARTYPVLLRADFQTRNHATGGTEDFTIAYGVEGELAEIPIFIAYQPRWWFKAELVLDETQRF